MDRLQQIRDLLEQEDYSQALRECENLIQETGGRGDVALLTAQVLVGLARLQEAETWVQRARVDLQDETQALRLLAQIYRRRGWRVRAQAIERRLGPSNPAQAVKKEKAKVKRAPSSGWTNLAGGAQIPTVPAGVSNSEPAEPSPSAPQPKARVPSIPQAPREPSPSAPAAAIPDQTPPPRAPAPTPAPTPAPAQPVPEPAAPAAPKPLAPPGRTPGLTPPGGQALLPKLVNSTFDIPTQAVLDGAPSPPASPDRAAEEARTDPAFSARKQPNAGAQQLTSDDAGIDPLGLLSSDDADAVPSYEGEETEDVTLSQNAEAGDARPPVVETDGSPTQGAADTGPSTSSEAGGGTSDIGWAAPSPRARRHAAVDSYTAQRNRAKFMLILAALVVFCIGTSGWWLFSEWKKENLERALLATQHMIDQADYEGLKAARATVREVIGESQHPDGELCARGSQVELYLWIYYTGDRAYLQQARELLEDAEMRAPDAVETRFTRALWEGYLGDASLTQSMARELEDDDRLRPDRVHLLRGVASSSMGDHTRAAKHFELAVSLAPTALNHLAFAREAERYGALTDAQDQLEAILEIHPSHVVALVDLALLRAGMPTDKGFLEAVEAVQEEYNGKVPPRVMSRVFASKARCYAVQGDIKESAKWFDQALGEDPENSDLLIGYAHELRVWGDLSAARAQLGRVERNQPNSGDALGELAIISFMQDRPDVLSARMDAFPEGARKGAAYGLADGLAKLMADRPDDSVAALSDTPQELWGGEARLLLGEAQLAAGDFEDARTSFEHARGMLEKYRGKTDPLVSVAVILAELAELESGGRIDGATVDRALAKHRRYPVVLYSAARLSEARGNNKAAAKLYRRAFEKGGDFSQALLGFVRVAQEDKGKAKLVRSAAERYLAISPQGPHAAEMKQFGQ